MTTTTPKLTPGDRGSSRSAGPVVRARPPRPAAPQAAAGGNGRATPPSSPAGEPGDEGGPRTPAPDSCPAGAGSGSAAGRRWGRPAGGQRSAPVTGGARLVAGADSSPRHRKAPLTGLALIASKMPEAELESGVRDILKDLEKHGHKVLAFHPWSSKHSAGGWPDWAFCTVRGLMIRELKKQREKPRADQQEWLDWLTAAGVDADVWRPADLLSGRCSRELAALAGMGGAG